MTTTRPRPDVAARRHLIRTAPTDGSQDLYVSVMAGIPQARVQHHRQQLTNTGTAIESQH